MVCILASTKAIPLNAKPLPIYPTVHHKSVFQLKLLYHLPSSCPYGRPYILWPCCTLCFRVLVFSPVSEYVHTSPWSSNLAHVSPTLCCDGRSQLGAPTMIPVIGQYSNDWPTLKILKCLWNKCLEFEFENLVEQGFKW